MEIPFVGGAYTGRSTNLNAQQCINLFPVVDSRDAKNPVALQGTPGLTLFATFAYSGYSVRALHTFGNVLYTVLGHYVYSTTMAGVSTVIGTIAINTNQVFMADNGTEVIIVDGTDTGYLITAGVLSTIADTDFPVANSVTFLDGYFIISSSSGTIYVSGLYDGTSWDALDFASAESDPDDVKAVLASARDLWLFGGVTTEVFYNSGNVDFPFTRIPGAVLEIGIESAATAVEIDGVIYWLSDSKRVVRTSGYQFETKSTTHIDYQISTYSTTSDAKGFSYELSGHIFYVLTFPTESKTWVYDITTDFWHEWQSYSTADPAVPWLRHRSNACAKFNGDYIVGDYTAGLLYKLDQNVYTDNSHEIRRLRATQVVNKERYNIIWHSIEVDFETGVGLTGGVQGEDPQAALQWSDDGGRTWSNEHWVSFGKIGEYETRVIWRRLGMARNRIFRLIISDPVKVFILAAYAELEECSV